MKKREQNVDLFRIIATFFVVVLHVLGKGGILDNTAPGSAHFWAAWFVEIGAYCAVNCFALISGYVMLNRPVKIKNLVGLWMQLVLYSVLLTVVVFVLVPETRGIGRLALAFVPVIGGQWWYISAYFALCVAIPVLNTAIAGMSRQTFRNLLLIILIGLVCMSCLLPLSSINLTNGFALNDGYSAIWLMIVYLFGAYIKKYQVHQRVTAGKAVLGYCAMVVLTFGMKFSIYYLTQAIHGRPAFDGMFVDYTSITILMASIFLFLFCLKLKVGKCAAKLIGMCSPVTLGVYLIHVHPMIYGNLLSNAFISFTNKSIPAMLLYAVAAALGIFILCGAIDWLRLWLFKLVKVGRLCEKIEESFQLLYVKIFGES